MEITRESRPEMTDHPITLAREVLDLTHEDETVTVCSVPDNKVAALARAVIDLTARLDAERFAHANTAVKVKRVEALAETWEEATRLVEARGGDAETVRDILQDIRAALNGDPR